MPKPLEHDRIRATDHAVEQMVKRCGLAITSDAHKKKVRHQMAYAVQDAWNNLNGKPKPKLYGDGCDFIATLEPGPLMPIDETAYLIVRICNHEDWDVYVATALNVEEFEIRKLKYQVYREVLSDLKRMLAQNGHILLRLDQPEITGYKDLSQLAETMAELLDKGVSTADLAVIEGRQFGTRTIVKF